MYKNRLLSILDNKLDCSYHIFIAPIRYIIEYEDLKQTFGHVRNGCKRIFNHHTVQWWGYIGLRKMRCYESTFTFRSVVDM
jgi:hypothetical protein